MYIEKNRVTPTTSVAKANQTTKRKRERVEPVQKTMYDEAQLVMMSVTNAQIDRDRGRDQGATMGVKEVTMKKKISVKRSQSRNRYQNVVLTLKFRELCPIWVVTYILLSYQISCQSKHGHLTLRHMKTKSMKRRRSTKKDGKGK